MCLALGFAAGVLRLESLAGVMFYLVGFTVANFTFLLFCCEGKLRLFFKSPMKEIFVDKILAGVAGYLMMWCLISALVK